MKNRLILLACILAVAVNGAMAQVKIKSGTTMKVSGLVSTDAIVDNASSNADFTTTQLTLLGNGQRIVTSTPLVLNSLTIDGGGNKTISGKWQVTGSLIFADGTITPDASAEFTYSGSNLLSGSSNSFVDGYLYISGAGQKYFPIGSGTTYAPAVFTDAPNGEAGMRVVAGSPGFTLPEGITSQFTGHYWQSASVVPSAVSLSTNGLNDFISGGNVVLTADAPGSSATSLSGALNGDFITSSTAATQSLFAVGKVAEFSLVIHDMITPFTADEVNDKLFIENIDLTPANHVRLLDRWGVTVATWTNYQNDVEYDFSSLSPGNYVCIVEFAYPGETTLAMAKGMVTVLKTK